MKYKTPPSCQLIGIDLSINELLQDTGDVRRLQGDFFLGANQVVPQDT